MEYSSVRNRPGLNLLTCPRAPSATDSGYFSVNGAPSPVPSQSNCGDFQTMSASDWSRYSPPYFQEQSVSPNTMSESDKSRDSPPYFNEQSIREKNTGLISKSTKKHSDAFQKIDLSSPVGITVFLLVVATALYFVCTLFSRETKVYQDVKIVLQSSSGEEKFSIAIDELLDEIKQLKQEVETRVKVELQPGGDARQATDNSESFGLMSLIKLLFIVFLIIMVIGLIAEKVDQHETNRRK